MISLGDDVSRVIRIKAEAGIKTTAFKEMVIPLGLGIGGLIAQKRESYIIRNYLKDDRFRHEPWIDKIWRDEGMVSAIVAPIQMKDRQFGRLWIMNRDATPFDEEQKETLELFARLAALEVSRSRAMDKIQAFYSLATEMTGLGDRSLVENLTDLVQKANQLLGTDMVHIALADNDKRVLNMGACPHARSREMGKPRLTPLR
jgi:transcriptional regulator with GAF, ATPase, and Fis domain